MIRQFETAFAVFALFFLTGSTVTLLTPISTLLAYGNTGSPMVRILALTVSLLGAALFALHRGAINHLFTRYWPILIPPAFALISVFWAADTALSFRRGAALVLVTLFAVWLAERFSTRVIFNCVLAAMTILCALSLVVIFGYPGLGIHSAANGTNIDHIGAWRGLLAHKNDLGRMSAYTAALFVIAGFLRRKWRLAYFAAALVALTLVAGSRSGQAVVLFVLPLFGVVCLLWLKTLSPKKRAMTLVLLVPLMAALALVYGVVITVILEALGKDATLTGRTEIWYAVWQALDGHYLFGGGYGSGWAIVAAKVQLYLHGPDSMLSHAHNGYLDLMIDIGMAGVVVTLSIYVLTITKVFRAFMTKRDIEFAALGIATLVFCLAGNWVASFLLPHDRIFWVLIVVIFCKTRQMSTIRYFQQRPIKLEQQNIGAAPLTGKY